MNRQQRKKLMKKTKDTNVPVNKTNAKLIASVSKNIILALAVKMLPDGITPLVNINHDNIMMISLIITFRNI